MHQWAENRGVTDPICKPKPHTLVAGGDFGGGSERKQEEERKPEVTAAIDSWTPESGGWGRDRDGGERDRHLQVVNTGKVSKDSA